MSFFFCLVNLSVSVLSVMYYLFLYMATSDPDTLFSIQIHGLAGYIAGKFVRTRDRINGTLVLVNVTIVLVLIVLPLVP